MKINKYLLAYVLVCLVVALSFSREKNDTLTIADGGKVNVGKISTHDTVTLRTNVNWSDSLVVYVTSTEKETGKFKVQWDTIKREDYLDVMKYVHLEKEKNYVVIVFQSLNAGFGKEYTRLEFDTK